MHPFYSLVRGLVSCPDYFSPSRKIRSGNETIRGPDIACSHTLELKVLGLVIKRLLHSSSAMACTEADPCLILQGTWHVNIKLTDSTTLTTNVGIRNCYNGLEKFYNEASRPIASNMQCTQGYKAKQHLHHKGACARILGI